MSLKSIKINELKDKSEKINSKSKIFDSFKKSKRFSVKWESYFNVYEKIFEQRYTSIANINKLDYQRVVSDTVDVEKHDKTAKKYINKKILENSNYYKNLIVKISDIEKILD